LQNTDHEHNLTYYTELIRKEQFTAGRPVVILLPLAEEHSTNKEVGYLIEKLHTSGYWPVLVYVSCKMDGNMYTEIHQNCSYVILVSAPCKELEEYFPHFGQLWFELSPHGKMQFSLNSESKLVVSCCQIASILNTQNHQNLFSMAFGLLEL
jgi:hypothetical protein